MRRVFSIILFGSATVTQGSVRFVVFKKIAGKMYEIYDTFISIGNVLFLHDLCTSISVIEPLNIKNFIRTINYTGYLWINTSIRCINLLLFGWYTHQATRWVTVMLQKYDFQITSSKLMNEILLWLEMLYYWLIPN